MPKAFSTYNFGEAEVECGEASMKGCKAYTNILPSKIIEWLIQKVYLGFGRFVDVLVGTIS
jgi:hypothetical protein